MNRSCQAVVSAGLFRHSRWDGVLGLLAGLHGLAVCLAPSVGLIAAGVWWNSNTIAHNFLHLPFFRRRLFNRCFSIYLSILLGIPQCLWRDRHLAHHAGRPLALRFSRRLMVEGGLVVLAWTVLAFWAPRFFLETYLPGYALGLLLCQMQGRFEHAPEAISHYGKIYNALFFNDGYHAEHHARPGEHWTKLPGRRQSGGRASRWPAVLRWLDNLSLNGLERLVLKSKPLQRYVLAKHQRAFRQLAAFLPPRSRIGIIGGGLFPRTALIVQELLPDAQITIIEANADHLAAARSFLKGDVQWRNERFLPANQNEFDILIVPLAFSGDHSVFYRQPLAPFVLVHDWLWARAADKTAVISWPLFKRLNLVLHPA